MFSIIVKKSYLLLSLLLSLSLCLLAACSVSRPAPLPKAYAHALPWGAIDLDINQTGPFSLRGSFGHILEDKATRNGNHSDKVPFNILTLSGGGTRGAFGAGVISGWHDSGEIPEFDVVTGVSTGAVMSTFIFLGGEYLENVKNFYTTSHTVDIYTPSWLSFFSGYIMNPAPLKKRFLKHFNEDLLTRVAAEHAKGRRLYVGTTNLDTGHLTVWDMGAIASSSRPDKYQRYADIIYASSAMPIFLPPQYMSVDIDGESYSQMHIDGGIYANVFMIGLLVKWNEVLNLGPKANINFDPTLYVVANRKYRNRHTYTPVEQSLSSIIGAVIETETDLLFDRSLFRLYKSCKKMGVKFKMIVVPDEVNHVDDTTEFDPEKMSSLFKVGYDYGFEQPDWQEQIKINEYELR